MLRFYNGRVLPMSDGCALTTDEVWIDGDTVSYVGPATATCCCPASKTRTPMPA